MLESKDWVKLIEEAQQTHEPAYKTMRSNEAIVEQGYDANKDTAVYQQLRQRFGNYHIAYLQIYLEVLSSSLYAKNPELKYEKVRQLNYQVWDGEMKSMTDAMASLQNSIATGMPVDPLSLDILEDINYVDEINHLIDRQGETLAILATSYMNSPTEGFREKFNNLVKWVALHGVSFIGATYYDTSGAYIEPFNMPKSKESIGRAIEASNAEMAEAGIAETRKKELERRIQYLTVAQQNCPNETNQGVFFDFKKAYNVIVDPACTDLTSFKNAGWVAIEEDVKKQLLLDMYPQLPAGKVKTTEEPTGKKSTGKVKVFTVYDLETMTVFRVSPGYKEVFIVQPLPVSCYLPDFYPYSPVMWRSPTAERAIYPKSDIELAADSQVEANLVKIVYLASMLLDIPRFLSKKGALDEKDKGKLNKFAPLEVVEVGHIAFDAVKAGDLFQTLQMGVGKDIEKYNPQLARQQIGQILGTSDSIYGMTSQESATSVSLASDGTQGLFSYKRTRLDECLGNVARNTGATMLQKTPEEEVTRRVGPGAKWFTPDQVDFTNEIYLIAKAGTSNKTNTNDMLAKLERVANLLVQLPGVAVKRVIEIIADNLEVPVDELNEEGAPSVVAWNSLKQQAASVNELAQAGQGMVNSPNVQASTNALPEMTAPQQGIEKANVG